MVLHLVDLSPQIIDILLSIAHVFLQDLHVVDRALYFVMSNALGEFFVDLLKVLLDAVHFVQLLHDIVDVLRLLLRFRSRRVPPRDVLFGYFGSGRRLGSDFDGFAGRHRLDHLPKLVALLVKLLLLGFAVPDLLDLQSDFVQLFLVIVKQSRQVVNLLLLVLVLRLQGCDLGQQLIPQTSELLVKFSPELILDLLDGIEEAGSVIATASSWPVHFLKQVNLTFEVVQPLVMLLAGVTHILHVLVVLLVVVVDVVLQLQENGQGHARALLLYLTIQFEGIYQFSNFNPRFNERTSE